MILAVSVGSSRLHHLQYLEPEPMLLGILRVTRLPVQSTFRRFLSSLHGSVERQLARRNARLRERVWVAANVRLKEVTLDTDTTVPTLYGEQMGGRVSYNRKNRGKPGDSLQCAAAVTVHRRDAGVCGGCLHNGDKPSRETIARHLASVMETLPNTVEILRARADAGFSCWEAVQAYSDWNCEFVIVARQTERFSGSCRGSCRQRTGSPRPRPTRKIRIRSDYSMASLAATACLRRASAARRGVRPGWRRSTTSVRRSRI